MPLYRLGHNFTLCHVQATSICMPFTKETSLQTLCGDHAETLPDSVTWLGHRTGELNVVGRSPTKGAGNAS